MLQLFEFQYFERVRHLLASALEGRRRTRKYVSGVEEMHYVADTRSTQMRRFEYVFIFPRLGYYFSGAYDIGHILGERYLIE
jgi:hypothetical protein